VKPDDYSLVLMVIGPIVGASYSFVFEPELGFSWLFVVSPNPKIVFHHIGSAE
jgi:hypothetical protein